MSGLIYYGGAFNPVHIGHLRLAVETAQLFGECADSLIFLPSYKPPHKKTAGILPIELRKQMIDVAIAGIKNLACDDIEKFLPTPSFTYETLRALGNKTPEREIFFLLGSGDFELLSTWHRGLDLIDLCNLIIVPRGNFGEDHWQRICQDFWKSNYRVSMGPVNSCTGKVCAKYQIAGKKSVYYAPIPYLEVSGSKIRQMWLCGQNIDFLTPRPVLDILEENEQKIGQYWQEK